MDIILARRTTSSLVRPTRGCAQRWGNLNQHPRMYVSSDGRRFAHSVVRCYYDGPFDRYFAPDGSEVWAEATPTRSRSPFDGEFEN